MQDDEGIGTGRLAPIFAIGATLRLALAVIHHGHAVSQLLMALLQIVLDKVFILVVVR